MKREDLPLILMVVVAIGLGVFLGTRGNSVEDTSDSPPPSQAEAPPPTTQTQAQTEEPSTGRDLFAHDCSTCHTLRAAGGNAGIGPDLDKVKPSRQRVLQQIRTGSLDGSMPANLVTGADAEKVAAYVSRVAGRGSG